MKYTKEHEWLKMDGVVATVGITNHAAEQLGDLVFVELPNEKRAVSLGEEIVVIESVSKLHLIFRLQPTVPSWRSIKI